MADILIVVEMKEWLRHDDGVVPHHVSLILQSVQIRYTEKTSRVELLYKYP